MSTKKATPAATPAPAIDPAKKQALEEALVRWIRLIKQNVTVPAPTTGKDAA